RPVEFPIVPPCHDQSPAWLPAPGSVDRYSHLSVAAVFVSAPKLWEPTDSDRPDLPSAECTDIARYPCGRRFANPGQIADTASRQGRGPVCPATGQSPDLPRSCAAPAAST